MPVGGDYAYNRRPSPSQLKFLKLMRKKDHKRQFPLLYDHYGKRKQ